MKRISLIAVCLLFFFTSQCQVTGSLFVQGSINSYYPVTFYDGGWGQNVATELTLGRSNVHQDGGAQNNWVGAFIAKFKFHVTNWGNGSPFVNADISQGLWGATPLITNFIGGWQDVTPGNGTTLLVIWLRGGGTTYYYNSNYAVTPVVYDGIANALPYNIVNGGTLTFKTTPDAYVNQNGTSLAGTIYTNGTGNNYFAGNVGIGTTAPISKFHLALNNTPGINITGNNSSYIGSEISISRSSAGAGAGQSPAIQLNDGSNSWGSWIIQGSVANGLQFFGTTGSGWYEKMRLDQYGNLGIGTTSPVAKLDVRGGNVWINAPNALPNFADNYALNVNGFIRANKIVVNTTGADFVFEPGYKLTPLNKVEEYVQLNHRLPGIEPAAAMQKDGVDVGDNQTKLLQKIEELTLYVIEQNKKNGELSKTVEAQSTLLKQQQELLKKMQEEIDKLKK